MVTCQFRGCRNPAIAAFEISGNLYYLCEKHYKLMFKWMMKMCEEQGTASLSQIKIKTRGNRITKVYF